VKTLGPDKYRVGIKPLSLKSVCTPGERDDSARRTHRSRGERGSRGFTLVELLVCISVIAVLIGLLIPSLAAVNETARRVVCQSNVRQIGLAVIMYSNDYNGQLPMSRFVSTPGNPSRAPASPEKMITVRVTSADAIEGASHWDGLGLLYQTDYLSAPRIFYCPSHRGENPYSLYSKAWGGDTEEEIICNYHFRGEGPVSSGPVVNGVRPTTRFLWSIDPAQSSLIADGMRVRSDYNHKVGVNFFRADLSVHWFDDPTSRLQESLPVDKDHANSRSVREAWDALDASANAEFNGAR